MSETIIQAKQVGEELAGQRVDQAAATLFPDFSRARLQAWIREGRLTVDGAEAKASQRIAGGEHLRLEAETEPAVDHVPQRVPLDIVHADEHLVLVNKPADLVVHPAPGNPDRTLLNGLLHFDPALADLPRAGIVHRLDKDTTGIMVVARSLKAHASLVEQLRTRRMSRTYEAVAHGVVRPRGTIDAPVARHPRDRKRMAVVAGGKPAVSHFRRLAAYRAFSHVEVSLETGRTHQIRVHFAHIGHPLVGDAQYGKRLAKKADVPAALREVVEAFPRQALHARRLEFDHPATGERVRFEAPIPEDLAELLAALAALGT